MSEEYLERSHNTSLQVPVIHNHVTHSSLFTITSRPAVGLVEPPIHWVPGFFPWRQSSQGIKLANYPTLMPWLTVLGVTCVLAIQLHGMVLSLAQETPFLFLKYAVEKTSLAPVFSPKTFWAFPLWLLGCC